MKPLKTKISVTLDDPILEEIKKLAEADDRSVSSFINLVLRDYLAADRQRDGLPGEGTDPSLRSE